MAVLCRQTGLIVALFSIVLFKVNKKWKYKFWLVVIPILLTWLANDKFRHYLTANSIPHNIKNTKFLFDYLTIAPLHNHIMHAGDSLIIVGLFLLPITIVLFFQKMEFTKAKLLLFLLLFSIISYLAVQVWHLYPLGNVTTIFRNGPLVVKRDFNESLSIYLSVIAKSQIIAGTFSISVLLTYLFSKFNTFKSINTNLFSFIGLCLSSIFFIYTTISEAYFDRYTIPFIFFLIISILVSGIIQFKSISIKFAYTISVIVFIVSVIQVKDFFEWQNVRWEALTQLHKKGIFADKIDGGFEYNGWYKPINGWSEQGKSWWWVKEDEYVVSIQRLNGYKIDNKYLVNSAFRMNSDTIYVLKRF